MNKTIALALLVAGLAVTGFAWYRTELERARQQGIAETMAKQADLSRLAFDSAMAAQAVSRRAANDRIARLTADSALNAQRRGVLADASLRATQRADSILAVLMDSLPQLAGVKAALDTLQQQVLAERDGRILAERGKAEAIASAHEFEVLLASAGKLIEEQAATIKQLKVAGHSGGGGVTVAKAVTVLTAVAGAFILGAVTF